MIEILMSHLGLICCWNVS